MSNQKFVIRLVALPDIPRIAQLVYAANYDPEKTTEDEIAQIASLDADPNLGHVPSKEETIARTEAKFTELYHSADNILVGIYLLPDTSSALDGEGLKDGDASGEDSSGLPMGSMIVGQAIWLKIPPSPSSSSSQQDLLNKNEQSDPIMINRFRAQLNRTRLDRMHNQAYYYLKVLTIHPDFQRKGLGTQLVKWGTRKADRDGINAWLETSPMGLGVYLNAGFRIFGMDRIDEPRAKRGYLEWPYMIYESQPQRHHETTDEAAA